MENGFEAERSRAFSKNLMHRTLTYFVRGSITVRLTFCWTGFFQYKAVWAGDSAKLFLNVRVIVKQQKVQTVFFFIHNAIFDLCVESRYFCNNYKKIRRLGNRFSVQDQCDRVWQKFAIFGKNKSLWQSLEGLLSIW